MSLLHIGSPNTLAPTVYALGENKQDIPLPVPPLNKANPLLTPPQTGLARQALGSHYSVTVGLN